MRILLQVSAGELFDRISILELKRARLPEPACSAVELELRAARAERERHVGERQLGEVAGLCEVSAALAMVNRELWEIEDELRRCEQARDFGARFVALARSVYLRNDRRAALKRRIDELLDSEFREQKAYALPNV